MELSTGTIQQAQYRTAQQVFYLSLSSWHASQCPRSFMGFSLYMTPSALWYSWALQLLPSHGCRPDPPLNLICHGATA